MTSTSIRFEHRARCCAAALNHSTCVMYDRIHDGLIPHLIKLGPRTRGLPVHEIDALNALRLAGLPQDRIRKAVVQIVASRDQGTKAPSVVQEVVEMALAHRDPASTAPPGSHKTKSSQAGRKAAK